MYQIVCIKRQLTVKLLLDFVYTFFYIYLLLTGMLYISPSNFLSFFLSSLSLFQFKISFTHRINRFVHQFIHIECIDSEIVEQTIRFILYFSYFLFVILSLSLRLGRYNLLFVRKTEEINPNQ